MSNRNGMVAYVIECGTNGHWKVDGKDDVPHLYGSIEDAEYVLGQMTKEAQVKRRVSIASDEQCSQGHFVRPKRASKKMSCLVEIYEDFAERKFALCSRAENEHEFLAEFATAFSQLPSAGPNEQATRVRELLPLVVDVCCKYRGSKAERVQQRVVLVAGDLEIPSLRLEAVPDITTYN